MEGIDVHLLIILVRWRRSAERDGGRRERRGPGAPGIDHSLVSVSYYV
jgi:hypothetical protein